MAADVVADSIRSPVLQPHIGSFAGNQILQLCIHFLLGFFVLRADSGKEFVNLSVVQIAGVAVVGGERGAVPVRAGGEVGGQTAVNEADIIVPIGVFCLFFFPARNAHRTQPTTMPLSQTWLL